MRNLKIGVCLLVISICFSAQALELKSWKSEDAFPKATDIQSKRSIKGLSKLAQIKWHQLNGQWQSCAEKAGSSLGAKDMGVWLPYVHASCLKSWIKATKKNKVSGPFKSFAKLKKHQDQLLASPFSGHRERLIEVFLELAGLSANKARNRFDELIDSNHHLVDYMSADQRGRFYQITGEMAWLRQKNSVAQSDFLRSYQFRPNDKVLNRLKGMKGDGSLKLDKYLKDIVESDEEANLFNTFKSAVKRGQTVKVAQNGVKFLNRFPGSRHSNQVRDDINKLYKRLLYRRGKQYEASKGDFEKALSDAPPQFIYFWSKEAYERGYQASSLKLSEAAIKKWRGTPEVASALIMGGRSSYYLGKRKQAQKFFEELIEKHSGHPGAQEAFYYLGLSFYRAGEYDKVISVYDRFLTTEGSDKWELQVRYWLWRALKKQKSPRTAEIAETLLKNFPLTYYGLIVRMEEKKSLQNLIATDAKPVKVHQWWSAHSKSAWKRYKKLLKEGWIEEAESELDFFPDPQSGEGFLVRAKVWQSAGLMNRAIGDFASAIDLSPGLLDKKLLGDAFPQSYKKAVDKAAKEFGIPSPMVWAIMRQESAFMPRAISPSNAYGLMQLLEPTGRETAKWLKVKRFKVPYTLFETTTNVRFGTHFFSRMNRKYKGIAPLAIASYNVGPGNLDRWLNVRADLSEWEKFGASPDDDMWIDELPWAETSYYVKAVMRNYLLYQIIHDKLDKLPNPTWQPPS